MNTSESWPLPRVRLRPINGNHADSVGLKRSAQQNGSTVDTPQNIVHVGSPYSDSRPRPRNTDTKEAKTSADDLPMPPLSSSQSRRLQRYTIAESGLLRRLSHVSAEPSSQELQIRVLQQATSMLSSYAERSKEHAERIRSLIVDSNGELDREAYRELKQRRWMEERRQVQLEFEKKVASEQLKSLLHADAVLNDLQLRKDLDLDTESRRCANLLKFFAHSDSVTLVPVPFGKGPITYNSMSAIQSRKRKHPSADGHPLPLESVNSLSSKYAKQRLRASASALTALQAPTQNQKRQMRRPASLTLGVIGDTVGPSRLHRMPSYSTIRSSPSQLSLATLSDSTHPTPITGESIMFAHHAKPHPYSPPGALRARVDSGLPDGRYGIATIYTDTHTTPDPAEPPKTLRPAAETGEKVPLPGYAISLINSLDEIHESFSLRPFSARTISARKAVAPTSTPAPTRHSSASKPPPAARSGKKGPPRETKALPIICEAPAGAVVGTDKFASLSSASAAGSAEGHNVKHHGGRLARGLRSKSISSFREVVLGRDKKKEEEEREEGLKSKVKKRFSGFFA